jgi:hypothetical protein
MSEISEENLDNNINNEEVETIINEEAEPIKRGRGRPKT